MRGILRRGCVVSGPATLGFIGLGVMGGRMCRNLARKSVAPVIGYDVVPARIAECVGAGVEAGEGGGSHARAAGSIPAAAPGRVGPVPTSSEGGSGKHHEYIGLGLQKLIPGDDQLYMVNAT